MKILFFGDSITEAGRNLLDRRDLGVGYVKIVAGKLRLLYPEADLEFLNCGVGGDTTADLLVRIGEDVVDQQPDCVVLQVGINDVWKRFSVGEIVTPDEFRGNYEKIVAQLKATGAKLVIIQPYLLKIDDKQRFRPYLNEFLAIIREIAEREQIPVVPMDEIFTGLSQDIKPAQFSADGVHPTHRGCRYIADCLIKELKKSVL